MESIGEIASAMTALLTTTAARLGRELGFVQRRSKLDGAGFAQICVLGWQQHPNARLSQLAGMAAQLGVPISPQGLDQRFDERAAAFLRALVAAAMTTLVGAAPVEVALLRRFRAVIVQDSTVISLPEALERVWAGCGDVVGRHRAALKIQLRVDLLRGTLDEVLLRAGRVNDQDCARQSGPLPDGALYLSDLGYFNLARLAQLGAQGITYVSRFTAHTIVHQAGERLDLATRLKAEPAPLVDWAITLGAAEHLPVRLVGARVRQEVADQRRRALKEDARKRGRALSQARLALVDWTLLITNAKDELLQAREVFVLARLRWQVELIFKLWKQHIQLDDWRSAAPWRILVEVYAKLLGALLQHWLLVATCWHFPDRSLVKATAIIRDHAILIGYALRGFLNLAASLDLLAQSLHDCPRLERRRKRPAAFQLVLDTAHAA